MKKNLRTHMKINLLLALFAAASLQAAPLTSPTPVHAKPEASSPSIAVLKPGTEPKPAVGVALPLPSGWSAVELDGPHEAFIQNKDLQKNLDVRPGASFYTAAKVGAPVLATMQQGDQVEIIGYQGRWTQVKVHKKVVGYIQGQSGALASANTAASSQRTAANAPAQSNVNAPAQNKPAPFSPAPAAPAAVTNAPGRPVQSVNLGDGGSASLPRLFQGTFVSTRSLLRPRRPYDYQLNDSAGQRYAYLDTTRLLQIEQIEKYVDRVVAVYGTAKPIPGSKDIVIEVESLQLK
jgi:hypothetical protein